MSESQVEYERRGPLAVIRLQRPDQLNALTHPMIAAIERFARTAEADPEIVALCITGAGRGFCAGLDMSVLIDHSEGGAPTRDPNAPPPPPLFGFLRRISKPVIAAVNGVGAGGGFILAMMCDLRFMAQEASLITVFSRRGLIAEHGSSWLLPRIVGLSRALDLLWSSRRVSAEEALRIGLADRVAPAGDVLAAVEAYVADLAATVSPTALAVIKAQVGRHLAMDFDAAAVETDQLMSEALARPDASEGARSFVERRPPQFAAWTGDTQ